jgi:hypothetical protein
MIFYIFGKSLHHQIPPNWSSDPQIGPRIPQKLEASGPAAFGENGFWKMSPNIIILKEIAKPSFFV